MRELINPILPGFNPDPSIVRVGDAYYLVTSTFEYLPGLPVYRSTDLQNWVQIGNVATRQEQVQVREVPTGCGVYAPTIRYRDGVFHVIVTVAMSPAGCVLFTATNPAGPWSDGISLQGVPGIDPDLAWDDDGTAYVTYSGISFSGDPSDAATRHHGICQVRVDLTTGKALESPRALWSGSGFKFPEAPHLYQRDGWWYLLIAEGGTERGHAVSVARSKTPAGPFEPYHGNPVLSARSTSRAVQNTGHADLVDAPDGETLIVLLGVRPLGLTASFSPLGRETFATGVNWVDDWPLPEPVEIPAQERADEEAFVFDRPEAFSDPGWLAIRELPSVIGGIHAGRLAIAGNGKGLDARHPQFIGRRQRHLRARLRVNIDASRGSGGLAARFDELHWLAIEVCGTEGTNVVTAKARVSGLAQDWTVELPQGEVELRLEMTPPPRAFVAEALGGDRIRLMASSGTHEVVLAELDGRFWTAESCTSFTGRVLGMFATQGTVTFRDWHYRGGAAA
jgi:xylan 1,4-beta-xylosidase